MKLKTKEIIKLIILILFVIFTLILILWIQVKKKKNLFMCYNDKSKIPQKVYDNANKYAPDYNLQIYDDNEIIQFFKDHYDDSERYINSFNELQGAHKADLWRYCVLYHYGGVYLDVKTELIKPLNEIFVDDNILYTCLSHEDGKIHQGIMSTPPKNPIFLELIEHVLNIGKEYDFNAFIIYFNDKINEYCNGIKLGLNKNLKNDIDIYLFNERCYHKDNNVTHTNMLNVNKIDLKKLKCNNFDKYNLCCYIYNNNDTEPIIKTRFDDFGKEW